MRVVYLPSADADLVEIHTYIFERAGDAADRQIDRIRHELERLRAHPLSAPSRPEIAASARGLTIGSYTALHRVAEDRVEIVRVVHAARDMRTFAADFGEP